jgi:hypothetical protein
LVAYYAKRPEEKSPPDGRITPCLRKGSQEASLGWVADKILKREAANRRAFLALTAKRLSREFDVYVYGHTHAAVAPFSQKVEALWTVRIANDGAFQRVVTTDQLEKLAKKNTKTVPEIFAHLQPEDLQPCYAYVRVDPYAANDAPTPKLRWWTLADGTWLERDSCPPWP